MDTPKVYLDVCSYNRPFDSQTQMRVRLETEAKLFIQSCIREKKYSMAWSYMLDSENGANPDEEKKSAIALWKGLADYYCPPSDDILKTGSSIMGLGVKAKDALHLACALSSGCDYFITTDDKLTNKTVSGIKIINPIDFVREMEA
jgi:predicted nucleic acid-binding protein